MTTQPAWFGDLDLAATSFPPKSFHRPRVSCGGARMTNATPQLTAATALHKLFFRESKPWLLEPLSVPP